MASTTKIPTIRSKSLTVAIRRGMALRDMRPRELADESGVPYGTLRRILELNTVADYEQLSKIANALRIPLSGIVTDAEELCEDADFVRDYQEETLRDSADDVRKARAMAGVRDDVSLAAYRSRHKGAYIDGDAAGSQRASPRCAKRSMAARIMGHCEWLYTRSRPPLWSAAITWLEIFVEHMSTRWRQSSSIVA